MLSFIFFVGLGYLFGSVNSAILVSRLFSLPDPRQEGSKNPGATNVLRLAGKQYGALVLLADLIKGFIPVLLAEAFHATPLVVSWTALAAVFGHMFPVFFEFRGGKGVATAMGALLAFHTSLGIMVAITWLAVARLSHYSSLASIVAIGFAPLYSLLLLNNIETFPALFFIALFVLYKHGDNIGRLVDGTEHKIKLKKNLLDEVIPDTKPTAHELEEPKETNTEAKTQSTQKKQSKKE